MEVPMGVLEAPMRVLEVEMEPPMEVLEGL